jgi:Raf kinase inhibitor-like YbhB/YbcL family protein
MLTLNSPAFENNGSIPPQFTVEGDDVSPPLEWSDVPPGTKSFVLIIDDPDAPDPQAPRTTWVHWVLYNIPAGTRALADDVARRGLPAGTCHGSNDWKRAGYGGPAPPVGRHRYFHKLYALDVVLPDLGLPAKQRLLQAMRGHVLAESQLVGTYEMGR